MTDTLVITGPTSVGKTEVAVEVAERLDGEVISMDSRQVYRLMDIGTAKPGRETLSRVKHHLVDEKDPAEQYSAGEFARDAVRIAKEIEDRGNTPILCGGATLYLHAVTVGLFREPDNLAERKKERAVLLERSSKEGLEILYSELREVDPDTADRISSADVQRITRALEVYLSTGIPLSQWHRGGTEKPDLRPLCFCLYLSRQELAWRIERRTGRMIEHGLVDEVRKLLDLGYPADSGPLKSVGYGEVVGFIKGEYSLDEAVRLINMNTRRYAKRQMTWFRRMAGLTWMVSGPDAAKDICESWIRWKNDVS